MKVAISTSGLGKTFCHGWGNPATFSLDGVSLEIPAGGTTGIFGRNGSGKTTLVKLICGLIRPTIGSVLIFGNAPALALSYFKTALETSDQAFLAGRLMVRLLIQEKRPREAYHFLKEWYPRLPENCPEARKPAVLEWMRHLEDYLEITETEPPQQP